MKEEEKIRICEYLRFQRETNNFSYRKLTQKSQIAKSILCKLEGSEGYDFNPTLNTLSKILECYDKTLFELFEYVYDKKSKK